MNSIPPHITPYNVPNDYFNNLSTDVMNSIKAMESEEDVIPAFGKVDMPYVAPEFYFDSLITSLSSITSEVEVFEKEYNSRSNHYQVPQGYFENLSDIVLNRINSDEDDMIDTSFIDAIGKNNPYTVDAQYFEDNLDNTSSIFTDIDNDEYLVKHVGKANPFTVPAHYFEQQLEDIDYQLKAVAGKEMPYTVPSNYFDTISVPSNTEQVEKLINNANQYKRPVFKALRMVRWAAAASLLLIFGIGGYLLTDTSATAEPSQETTASKQLSLIPKEDISQYIKNNIDDFDLALIEKVSVQENVEVMNTETLLDDVNDEDIEAYLEMEGI